jgi:hypothetical protein
MPTIDGLPAAGPLGTGDEVVVSQAGGTGPTGRQTGKTTLGAIQSWLGSIASAFSVGGLPLASTIAQSDFVAANVAGQDKRVQVATLLQGQTTDTLTTAGPVSTTDTVPVLQGGNILLQQSFSAIWTWITTTLPTYLRPTVELTGNTTLSIAHNQRMLICSASLTLTGTGAPAGLACDLIATSGATVTLAGFTTNTGTYTVSPGQSARITVGSYSAGALVYATLAGATLGSSSGSGGSVPAQVTGLTAGSPTSASVPLSWTADTGATGYTVQYRVTGTSSWTTFASGISGTSDTVTGLSASTSYDFQVAGSNSYGTGAYSSVVSASTASPPVSVPGAITGLAAGTVTSSTVPLTWTDPTSGGAATAFTVQYKLDSASTWTTATASLSASATSYTVSSLTASTAYDFQVFATNSAGAGTAASLSNVSTSSAGYTNYTVTIFNNDLPQNTTYSISGSGGYMNTAVVCTPTPSAIWFFTSQSSSAAPATGTTLNTSGGAQGAVANGIYYGYTRVPASPGTWYVYAVAVNGSGIVGGTVTGPSFTVTT